MKGASPGEAEARERVQRLGRGQVKTDIETNGQRARYVTRESYRGEVARVGRLRVECSTVVASKRKWSGGRMRGWRCGQCQAGRVVGCFALGVGLQSKINIKVLV